MVRPAQRLPRCTQKNFGFPHILLTYLLHSIPTTDSRLILGSIVTLEIHNKNTVTYADQCKHRRASIHVNPLTDGVAAQLAASVFGLAVGALVQTSRVDRYDLDQRVLPDLW